MNDQKTLTCRFERPGEMLQCSAKKCKRELSEYDWDNGLVRADGWASVLSAGPTEPMWLCPLHRAELENNGTVTSSNLAESQAQRQLVDLIWEHRASSSNLDPRGWAMILALVRKIRRKR